MERYAEDVVPNYSDICFQRHFRLSRDTFSTIHDHLKDCPEFTVTEGHGGRQAIPVQKQLEITLWYLGTLDTIHRISDRFGVSESTILNSRDNVIAAVIRHMRTKIISWPTPEEKQVIKDYYERKNGFPGVIGSLDGTHIRISSPRENKKSYINRKGFHSIQLQSVCREDLTFTHCFTGFPGSCHDSRTLKNSDLWHHGRELCGDDHILADAAYPLQRWLITPYRDNGHLTPSQRHFNTMLSSNRVTIERAFGLLKGRFPRLTHLVVNKVESAVDIIMACCVFHNICIQQSDIIDEFMQRDQDAFRLNVVHGLQLPAEGVVKRDRIAANLP